MNFLPANYNLILGSSSIHRQKVLLKAAITFEVIAPKIDENSYFGLQHSPVDLALTLAREKNLKLQNTINITQPTIILTADQVVTYDGQIRGKPKTVEEARIFLKSYAFKPAQTISALAVYNSKSKKMVSGYDVAEININLIPDPQIEAIIKEGTVFSCAGGFAIEHHLMSPYVKEINKSTDSVIGMPLDIFKQLIDSSA